jgi:hypothetical protein
LLGQGATVDDLIAALARKRERAVVVLPVALSGNAPSGAWIPMTDRDYLLVPTTASPRRRAILCHEVGHILLGHEPALHDSLTPELMHALAPTLPLETTRKVLQRTGYTNRQEADAEQVGTALSAALEDLARAGDWEASSRLSSRLR